MTSPKQKYLDCALALFAERGFHGVSLADVAAELGLTKQSVIYHFRTKTALYGAVLNGMAARMEAAATLPPGTRPEESLARFAAQMQTHLAAHPHDARLILRELLDNPDRAATSRKWVLRRFLNTTTELLRAHPGWADRTDHECRAALYQLIGAVNYFAVSGPTLTAIWDGQTVAGMQQVFLPLLLEKL